MTHVDDELPLEGTEHGEPSLLARCSRFVGRCLPLVAGGLLFGHLAWYGLRPALAEQERLKPLKKKLIYAVSEPYVAQTLQEEEYDVVLLPSFTAGRTDRLKAAIVGAVTCLMAWAGYLVGRIAGSALGRPAEAAGGALLIAIGGAILARHLGVWA